MNINEKITHKRKLGENLRDYTYKITSTSTANYSILQDLLEGLNAS